MTEKKKVVLIGTNGIPAHYGGIETLAEYLARDLNEDYDLYCYCSKTPKEKRLETYRNTKLIYLPLKANGWQSILYDGWSILRSLRKHDVLVVLGCSCPFVMPFKKLTKKGIVLNSIGGRESDKVRGWKPLGKLEVAMKKRLGHWSVGSSDYVIIDNAANVEAFAKQATFKIKVSKVSKEDDSIILKVNIEISNPTKTSVSFEKPYILIKYGNKTLTSSKASSDIIRIEPQSTTTIKNYTLQIPIDLSTASIFIDIARRLGTSLTFTTPAAFVSALSDTLMTQILPQLTLNVLVYLPNKSMPVSFETKLSN